ncbi:phospholipid phosphatase 2-like isoform X2 [Anticarsia gemmatalis]|uniref:phospholipid phosphatase 2-like isoform X2 n=1 Tax=Anticarsia gemmatalis TaxID=129554 RepID=UPI003F770316
MVKPTSPFRTSIEGIKKMASIRYNTMAARRDLEAQSTKTCERRHSIWWSVAIDLPLLLIFLTLVGLFELGVIPNHKGGFYCNDPALSHPFTGDTVATEVLISTILIFPILIFLSTEYLFVHSDFLGQTRLRQTFMNSCYLLRTYIYGLAFNLAIVEVMKGIMGSPRPTFFALCEPDTAKTCNGSEYVTDYACTPNQYGSWYQMDSYRSFPSGHSSMSVYCGFFIAWYLQRRAFDWQHRTIFVVPILQMLCVSYAAICSLTRITDHRHHWWDVLVGTLIGLATVYYAVLLSRNFSSDNSKSSNDQKSEQSQHTVRTLLYDERHRATVS